MNDGDDDGARIETADFAPSRVGGRGRRGLGPLLIAGWIAVLAGVVGAGTIGRTLDGSSTGARPLLPSRGAPSIRASVVAGGAPELVPAGPARSSDPDPLAYSVVGDGSGLTITGTVLARPTVWVFISIQNAAGDVLSWRSLSIEDANGGIRPDRTPAFQVHVPLATADASRGVVVEVNAYNNIGRKIGAVRQAYGERAGHNPIRIGTSVVR